MRLSPSSCIGVIALALLAGCRKEHHACGCHHAPVLTYVSWPGWMSVDSVLPVVDSYMPLVLSVTADPEDEAHDVKVTHISIQIHADANDSLIYTEDRQPGTATAEVNEALDLGNVTTAIPATIRVTATNACGLMSTQERPLLIKPE